MRSKLIVYPALAMAAVLCGATAAGAHSALSPNSGAHDKLVAPKITLGLSSASYRPGTTATLQVTENIKAARTLTVTDSSGAAWTKVADDGTVVMFTATTTDNDGTVSVTMTRTVDGTKVSASASYQVNPIPQLSVSLDKSTYDSGDTATLQVSENINVPRTLSVQDSSGSTWLKTADDGTTATFTATAAASGTVAVTMTRTRDLATASGSASYTVNVLWAGQQPGKFYLGMSCGTVCAAKEPELGQAYGVHRQFKSWGDWTGVAQDIKDDHAAGRLPWVSVKGPGGASGWQAVANGDYDADIKSLATTLKANDDKPVLLTFHHEPSNDGTEAEGAHWAAAYVRFHDVLKAEGALANVADPPILGDWLFNPRNRTQDPANWVTNGGARARPVPRHRHVRERQRRDLRRRVFPRIIDWMAARGYPNKMIGIGETGSTDRYPGRQR